MEGKSVVEPRYGQEAVGASRSAVREIALWGIWGFMMEWEDMSLGRVARG